MLISILSACVLCAVAEALMPKGSLRSVGKLVCGLVLLCAVLDPVAKLDLTRSTQWLEDYFAGLEEAEAELNGVVQTELKTVIEEKCSAYIVDKARELGLACTAQVICREGEAGMYLPDQAAIFGVPEGPERERLKQILEQDLGIPAQRQRYEWGEASA